MFFPGRWEIEIIKKIVRTDEVKELAAIDATLIGEKCSNLCLLFTFYWIQIWIHNRQKAENPTPDPDPGPEW